MILYWMKKKSAGEKQYGLVEPGSEVNIKRLDEDYRDLCMLQLIFHPTGSVEDVIS